MELLVRSAAEAGTLPWHGSLHKLSPPSKAALASGCAWHCQWVVTLPFHGSVAGAWPSL